MLSSSISPVEYTRFIWYVCILLSHPTPLLHEYIKEWKTSTLQWALKDKQSICLVWACEFVPSSWALSHY